MSKLKVFLAYHKKTPIYQSDVFEPIQVGFDLSDIDLNTLKDNTGDNISKLNKYYCELTGHYWVLKNYVEESTDKYIGFAHYRRLVDFKNISDKESPSIFGMTLSEADKFIKNLSSDDLLKYCEGYDILLPSKVYMYKNTVNPVLRDGENLNMYEHFKSEHNNDLMDELESLIKSNFTEYYPALIDCFNSVKLHFFNMYIMKKEIINEFLTWEFDVLYELGKRLHGWENTKYYRMAGFVGEQLINVWLKKHENQFKLGYFPVYMIDFEYEYIRNVNKYISDKDYKSAIKELNKVLDFTDNKLSIYKSIYELYLKSGDFVNSETYYNSAFQLSESAEDYYELASITRKNCDMKDRIINLYKLAINEEPDFKYYILCLLNYSEQIHDIDASYFAWQKLYEIGLDDIENEKYEHFIKIYKTAKLNY